MVVVGEVGQLTQMAAEMNRGTMYGTTTIRDPPRVGGVKVAPQVDKVGCLIASIVERKATEKTSDGKSKLTQARPNW